MSVVLDREDLLGDDETGGVKVDVAPGEAEHFAAAHAGVGGEDIRTLYVAMTRGVGINEAFFAVTREQTALDVFVQSMTADWIDIPASSRAAELTGIEPHRPGLLDGPMLRELMEERHAILLSLEKADSFLRALPANRRALEGDIADARQTITRASAEYRRAEAVIDTHDRPLRRRKHEVEIDAARRELQRQPEIARRAEEVIEASESQLERLAERAEEARASIDRRPELESHVAKIDDHLAHDRRVRTRIARLEAPVAIVDTLGPRPRNAQDGRLWDEAAGRLHQHQAAFTVLEGTGRWPDVDRSAYSTSHSIVDEAIDRLRPARSPGPAMPEIELGL